MPEDPYHIDRRAGDVVFREGDPAECAYIVEQGRVEVSVDREGRRVVLSELGAGEMLGGMAVIDQYSRTATATVVEDCRLTVVTPRQIQQRVDNADPVVRSLLRVLLSRYRSGLSSAPAAPLDAEALVSPHSGGVEKIRFEQQLRRALEDEQVNVAYQPILFPRDESIRGFEALVRWDHPVQGTIPAERLVSLAEETDLIVPLTLHVFKVAARDLVRFQKIAPRKLFMSVNVSPRHTNDSVFLDRAQEICIEQDVNPVDIMLELTESILVDIHRLSDWVDEAKSKGFQISVDDFGTGFASLEYLTRLAPDTVKIDHNFIRPIVEDPRHVVVMRWVVEMARDLDVLIIAEGAESREHVRVLTSLGCDMIQGYETGRPLTPSQVAAFLSGAKD